MTVCLLSSTAMTLQLSCYDEFLLSNVCAGVGSWLQLFGIKLHNVVPGFPKPEVGKMEQTYELMNTQTKTQDWDSSKVNLQLKQRQGSLD